MNMIGAFFLQAVPQGNGSMANGINEPKTSNSLFDLLLESLEGEQVQSETELSKETTEDNLNELIESLFLFTEEDWENLLGAEEAQKMLPELLEWQSNAKELIQTESQPEKLLLSFLAMFGLESPKNLINLQESEQNLHISRYTDATKSLLYRLMSYLETDQHQNQGDHYVNANLKRSELNTQVLQSVRHAPTESVHANSTGNHVNNEEKNSRILLQPNVGFQQGSMERLHQLEWRIQLLNHSDGSTLVDQFEKLIASSRLQTFKNGVTELNIRLYPEHLGSLSIKLVHQNGELIARITAQTEAAKSLIESQLHQLRSAFAGQNINVEKIEVLQSQQSHQQAQQEGSKQGNAQHERETEQKNEHEEARRNEEETSFREWLETLST